MPEGAQPTSPAPLDFNQILSYNPSTGVLTARGNRVVLMGTGPLLYLVAAQYVKAGAAVSAVFDTSTLLQRLSALPKLLAIPAALKKGIALMGVLRKARVRVYRGVRPLEIGGSPAHGVSHVEVALQSGVPFKVACDAVALGYHLRPETQLADLAGCEFSFDEATQQWLPAIDEDGRSSVKGIYLAGDGARIRGADAAEGSDNALPEVEPSGALRYVGDDQRS